MASPALPVITNQNKCRLCQRARTVRTVCGDEGYQVNVRQHTDLTGGLITSTAQAEAEGKNSFSTGTLSHSDIQNYSNYSASGFGLSGGVTISGGDAPQEIGGMKLQQV